MNIQDINLEIFLTFIAIFIGYKQYKVSIFHHKEKLDLDIKNKNKAKLKLYRELYYEEFLKVKKLLQNIQTLDDKIALLFHKYGKNKKDYLNHIYLDIQRSILNTLGDEIWWQNVGNLDEQIYSVKSIGKFRNHMFNDIKENIIKLKNSLDENLYDELEVSFIKIYDEFSLYFKSIEKYLDIALEQLNNILHKAKKEEVDFTDKLDKECRQIINLLEFMISSTREISANKFGTRETLTEDIVIVGIKLKIISELKEKILN
jgi:hypothetical protein